MNAGRIENFGRPYELIENGTGIFNEMLNSLDKPEKERLIEIAKKASYSVSTAQNTSQPTIKQTDLGTDENTTLSLDEAEKQKLL